MKYGIVVDSGCDIKALPEGNEDIIFERAPLKLRVGESEYVDDFSLDISEYMEAMKQCTTTTGSAAPSPDEWLQSYQKADIIFAITITGTLSGSHNSAMVAKDMLMEKFPDKQIHVIDSLSTGPEMTLLTYKLVEYMKQELPFQEIVDKITAYHQQTGLLFLLEALDNLVRNGRVNKYVASIVGILGIRIIGRASEKGTLDIMHKVRGQSSSYDKLVKSVIQDGFCGGKVVIAHCFNEKAANYIKEQICNQFPDCQVLITPTSGLCSYYAESNGLLIGFEKGNIS